MNSTNIPKFEWIGDLNDDCICHWSNLLLRAEQMCPATDENNASWWWAVFDMDKKVIQCSGSEDFPEITTGFEARQYAELVAIHWYKTNTVAKYSNQLRKQYRDFYSFD